MIDDYHFGSITINDQNYTNDVIVHGEKMLNESWWRKEGHNLAIEDLSDLPDQFEVLVIGNGHDGVCTVPEETVDFVKNKGVEVIVQMTGEATETFNRLLKEGKDVVGAFHLTC